MKVRLVATDVDGTLTFDRERYEIVPEAISRIQLLRELGIETILVTANAFPIAFGLARYVGASGVVAENGCMIGYFSSEGSRSWKIEQLCEWPTAARLDEIAKVLEPYATPSWQNAYRRCDYAFIPRGKGVSERALEALRRFLADSGLPISAAFSGYAIHVHPSGCSKLGGLMHMLRVLGVNAAEVMAIGDSVMDSDIVMSVGLGVAVANSDEELKRVAKHVTRHPSGFGFIEAVDELILLPLSKKRGE